MTVDELFERTGQALRGFTRLLKKQAQRSDAIQDEVEEVRDRVSLLESRLAALEEEK
ncbi:MAG: hypothetical protein ACRYGA_00570 [Janthinobacterium lividum]